MTQRVSTCPLWVKLLFFPLYLLPLSSVTNMPGMKSFISHTETEGLAGDHEREGGRYVRGALQHMRLGCSLGWCATCWRIQDLGKRQVKL